MSLNESKLSAASVCSHEEELEVNNEVFRRLNEAKIQVIMSNYPIIRRGIKIQAKYHDDQKV